MSTYRCRFCRQVHDGGARAHRGDGHGGPDRGDRPNYRIIWLRVRGPGRVAVKSVYEFTESGDKLDHSSFGSTRAW